MHYDLLSPRKGRDDKTRWHKVGAAFARDKGGFSLIFDSLPLPDAEGRVALMMWEATPKEEREDRDAPPPRREREPARQAPSRYGRDVDDEIPF